MGVFKNSWVAAQWWWASHGWRALRRQTNEGWSISAAPGNIDKEVSGVLNILGLVLVLDSRHSVVYYVRT